MTDIQVVLKDTSLLLDQNYKITSEPQNVQLQWLKDTGKALSHLGDIEAITVMGQTEILFAVWAVWDIEHNDCDAQLSYEVISRWDSDYFNWAKSYTKRRQREVSIDTIRNKIRVWRNWVARDMINYPEEVKIPARDDYGNLVDPSGESDEAWETVKFDPKLTDYSKLLMATVPAREGVLTEKQWSIIADPYGTVTQLKNTLKPTAEIEDDELKIYEYEGIIYAKRNGKRVGLFELLEDDKFDPLWEEAITLAYKKLEMKSRRL